MNVHVKFALIGSIKKWKSIASGEGEDLGPRNCPLCILFYRIGCYMCPVSIKTRRSGCERTPYQQWSNHRNDRHRTVGGKASCRTCKTIAKQEVKFLESLLPKGEIPQPTKPKSSRGV